MASIQSLLDATSEPDSINRLTLGDVKGWLADYLAMRTEEVVRFPDEKHASHWDLLAADYDSAKDAHLIAAYFSGDQITFLVGRGPIPGVRAFAEITFPENPDEILDALAQRFNTGVQWSADLDNIVNWVKS